jgi:hypothetical protein
MRMHAHHQFNDNTQSKSLAGRDSRPSGCEKGFSHQRWSAITFRSSGNQIPWTVHGGTPLFAHTGFVIMFLEV